MGLLRKAFSGSLAAMTGGASLAVIQFRSDTERGTRQVKELRQQQGRTAKADQALMREQIALDRAAIEQMDQLQAQRTPVQQRPDSTPIALRPAASTPNPLDLVKMLEGLHRLHVSGVLSDEEYQKAKTEALDGQQ